MTKDNITYEMAQADDPEDIIMATQRSFVASMINVIEGLRDDKAIKQPGLTWDQMIHFVKTFGEKKPTIVHQNGEM